MHKLKCTTKQQNADRPFHRELIEANQFGAINCAIDLMIFEVLRSRTIERNSFESKKIVRIGFG